MSTRLENEFAEKLVVLPGWRTEEGIYTTECQTIPGTNAQSFFMISQEGEETEIHFSTGASQNTLLSSSFQTSLKDYFRKLLFPDKIDMVGFSPDISSVIQLTVAGEVRDEDSHEATVLLRLNTVPPLIAAQNFEKMRRES